jgi:hypothetical protein
MYIYLVNFVVAVLAVPNNVDDNVRVKLVPPLRRQRERTRHGLHVVGVHVQNRAAERFAQIGRVHGAATLVRIRYNKK